MKKKLFGVIEIAFVLFFTLALISWLPAKSDSTGHTSVSTALKTRVDNKYGNIPLYFIPNQGQLDAQVAYYIQGRDKTIYFTSEGLTFILNEEPKGRKAGEKKKSLWEIVSNQQGLNDSKKSAKTVAQQHWVVKLDFVRARKGIKPEAIESSGTVVSYFKGKPEEWYAGLVTSSKIIYRNLWPGIDLIYSGTVNRMKYEFIVRPGADPSQIKLAYSGVDELKIDQKGCLLAKTPLADFADDVPLAWQDGADRRQDVDVAYVLAKDLENGNQCYGFNVAEYNPSLSLVLDPAVLIYCGYIGGSGDESGNGIAVDSSGNSYVTGSTLSTESTFPVTVGPYLTHSGNSFLDAFVAKVNAAGTALDYCGYIGGPFRDGGTGIAVDTQGNAYITGFTESSEAFFPVKDGPDLTYNGGYYGDAFVAKVNAAGTALDYCGYIGGSDDDEGHGIAVDGSGNAYVTGTSWSTETTFPVKVGPDLTHNGYSDAFVAKVNAAGTALSYCGYISGLGYNDGNGIAVDESGNAFVTGMTSASEETFPVAVGPDLTYNNEGDAFIAKVNSSGSALSFCGYIGGSGYDKGLGVGIDESGNVYVTGSTRSTEATFPVTVGPDLAYNGGFNDAFVAKVNSSGSTISYCGYIGGSSDDEGFGIAVDGSGNAYVTGTTSSTETTFPITIGPDLTYNGGYTDAFVAKVNSVGTALSYCGFIGGLANDFGNGIAVDGTGNVYVTGYTYSTHVTFPVVQGPDLTFNGSTDSFVAKISYIEEPANLTVITPNGGENWMVGESHAITWTSTGTITNVNIDYSSNSGGSWTPVIAGTANDGSYAWTVPNTPSTTCLVRVRDAADNDPSDNSDAVFTIVLPAETISAPSQPAGANSGLKSTSYPFTTDGSTSNLGHSIQYKFDWDDGTTSAWLASGTTSASHSWTANGTYHVRAMARCVADTAVISIWSDTHAITISDDGTLGKYNSPAQQKILPEVIWAPATGGGTWMSAVQITDISGGSQVSVYYNTTAGRRGPFLLWDDSSGGALSSVKYTNLLQTIDGLDSGAFTYSGTVGAVEFVTQDAAHLLQVTARTLNGNYSKTFPAFSLHDSNTADTSRALIIPNLTNNSAYRSTCGLFNPTSNEVTVELKLLDAANAQIGATISKTLSGYGFTSFSPFSEAGQAYPAHSYDNVILSVQPTSGTGKVLCFGASANNRTNDPAAHIAVQNEGGHDNGPGSLQILPEAVWAPATGGGTWMSEVQIVDVSGGSAVAVTFDYGGGLRRGPFPLWTGSVAGAKVKYTNMLQTIDGLDSGVFTYSGWVGTVEFATQDSSHFIQMTARTLNGNYSKTFPGLNLVDAETADTSRVMLIQNYTNNKTYRSTCGFFNPTAASVTVEFTLLNGSGAQLGTQFSKTFVGYDFQAFSPFNEAGVAYPANSCDNVIMRVRPTSGSGQVVCFGASANNVSNDPAAHLAVQGQ